MKQIFYTLKLLFFLLSALSTSMFLTYDDKNLRINDQYIQDQYILDLIRTDHPHNIIYKNFMYLHSNNIYNILLDKLRLADHVLHQSYDQILQLDLICLDRIFYSRNFCLGYLKVLDIMEINYKIEEDLQKKIKVIRDILSKQTIFLYNFIYIKNIENLFSGIDLLEISGHQVLNVKFYDDDDTLRSVNIGMQQFFSFTSHLLTIIIQTSILHNADVIDLVIKNIFSLYFLIYPMYRHYICDCILSACISFGTIDFSLKRQISGYYYNVNVFIASCISQNVFSGIFDEIRMYLIKYDQYEFIPLCLEKRSKFLFWIYKNTMSPIYTVFLIEEDPVYMIYLVFECFFCHYDCLRRNRNLIEIQKLIYSTFDEIVAYENSENIVQALCKPSLLRSNKRSYTAINNILLIWFIKHRIVNMQEKLTGETKKKLQNYLNSRENYFMNIGSTALFEEMVNILMSCCRVVRE